MPSPACGIIGGAIEVPGGFEAVQLRVAEQYVKEFGALAKSSTSLVLPASVSDVGAMISLAMSAIRQQTPGAPPPPPRR